MEYGLVLEGGGAKGAYHIGAYKAIMEENYSIVAVSGTSIGALNGAMIVQGDFDICMQLWQNISYSQIIHANDEEIERLRHKRLERQDIRLLADKLRSVVIDKGFDISPFKDMLDKYVDEEKIRNSELDFGVVTFNLSEMKPVELFKDEIPYGEIRNYLLASAYLPVFRLEKLGGKRYVDGGIYDNLPYRMLLDKGYENLIIIRTHRAGTSKKPNLDSAKTIVIEPSDDVGRSYTYEPNIARRNIEMGYYDALKQLRKLKGFHYYFTPLGEDYYLSFLKDIDDEKNNRISTLLGIQEAQNKRNLFEQIFPRISAMLDLNKDHSYEDFVLLLLEKLAKSRNLNRYSIYDFEEAIDLINEQVVAVEKRELSMRDRLIDKMELTNIFYKEEVLLAISEIIFDSYIGRRE